MLHARCIQRIWHNVNKKGNRHKLMCSQNVPKTTRPGFEPGQREPKSLVLPLHYRVMHYFRVCPATLEHITHARRAFPAHASDAPERQAALTARLSQPPPD